MSEFNYLKEKRRMLDSLGRTHGDCFGVEYVDCPLRKNKYVNCAVLEMEHSDEAIAIVKKWSDEHPVKTILQDFLEKYPDAPLDSDIYPAICPHRLGYEMKVSDCSGQCAKCWDCWGNEV